LKIRIIISNLCFFLITSAFASESQFGLINNSLGNIVMPYSAAGLSRSYEIAHLDSVQLNSRNFATATSIQRTILSINLKYNAFWDENKIEKSYFDNVNLLSATLGIDIGKRLVLTAGLQPYTSIEQILNKNSVSDSIGIDENFYITGGLSRAYLNFAYKVSDQVSVGLGYEYTFGKISEQIALQIDDALGSTIRYSYDNKISGSGLVASLFVSPLPKFHVGLMVRGPVSAELIRSGNTPSTQLNEDRIFDISLPTEINFGVEYNLTDKYSIGADLIYQDWKNGYKVEDKKIDQHNTYYHIGAGLEVKGSRRQFVKYGEQIDYRAGFFYSQLAHMNNYKQVSEIGFSLGLSLPIQRFRSKIDLAGYIAKRGDLNKNNLQEIIVGFGLSISASELWFVNIED
jgi:hypothetical protein